MYIKASPGSLEATYNPILHTEAQLVSEVRSPDQDCCYWRTPNYVQFNPGLVFQTLQKEITMKYADRDRVKHLTQTLGKKVSVKTLAWEQS